MHHSFHETAAYLGDGTIKQVSFRRVKSKALGTRVVFGGVIFASFLHGVSSMEHDIADIVILLL